MDVSISMGEGSNSEANRPIDFEGGMRRPPGSLLLLFADPGASHRAMHRG